MRKVLSLALTLALSVSTIAFNTGCSAQQTAAQVLAAAGPAVAAVVAAISPNNAALAQKIQADFAAASKAAAAFKGGTPCQDVEQALNIVVADMNLVPISTQYQTLVALAIAGVESVLAVFPACAPATANAHAAKAPTPKQWVKEWNAEVAKHPELPKAAHIK